MKYFHIVILLVVTSGLSSCSIFNKTSDKKATSKSFQTTKSGIAYKIYKNGDDERLPQEGEYVEIHLQTYYNDSLIVDSKKQTGGTPVAFPIREVKFNGDLTEALKMLTIGDSGIFIVPVDTLKAVGQATQDWMEEGKFIRYSIKLENITTLETLQKKQMRADEEQPEVDDERLQAFFEKNKIQPRKTESGLYYMITRENPEGKKAIPGQTVTVNYRGYLMDGTIFDSNVDQKFGHVEPFQFVLGRGQVIRGWDEGIALLRRGEQATLFVPSGLAYGNTSPTKAVPENSILIFEVELLP